MAWQPLLHLVTGLSREVATLVPMMPARTGHREQADEQPAPLATVSQRSFCRRPGPSGTVAGPARRMRAGWLLALVPLVLILGSGVATVVVRWA